MARARNIKPKFFKNDDLADLGPLAQLLFAGLWCLADREGRLEDKPRFIKAEIFPYYDCDVNGELTKLERLGFVRRYKAKGIAVISIPNFKKHQSPHNTEKASELPEEEQESPANPHEITGVDVNGGLTVDSPKPNGGNPPDSLIPDSRSLIEDTPPVPVEPPAAKSSTKKRKNPETPLPEDFGISGRVKAWAQKKGYGQLDLHLENFICACKKKGYTYVDWDEGFMDAIRKDWAKLRQTGGFQGAPPVQPVSKPIPSVEDQVPSLKMQKVPGLGSLKDALKKQAA